MLGVLLAGIVAMRVEVLKLGVSAWPLASGRQLSSRASNQTLRADVASLLQCPLESNASPATIGHGDAGSAGRCISSRLQAPNDVSGAAVAGIVGPDPTTFEAGLQTPGSGQLGQHRRVRRSAGDDERDVGRARARRSPQRQLHGRHDRRRVARRAVSPRMPPTASRRAVDQIDRRVGLLFVVFLALLVSRPAGPVSRSGQASAALPQAAATQQVETRDDPRRAGTITDRNGVELADQRVRR